MAAFPPPVYWLVLYILKNGLEFISSLEAKEYPFYGTQYHPEKNSFEWTLNYPDMAHTRLASITILFQIPAAKIPRCYWTTWASLADYSDYVDC